MSVTKSTLTSDPSACRAVLEDVLTHPTMYGLDGRYAVLVGFLHGCDVMTGRQLLDGFDDWLVDRHLPAGSRSSLGWEALINKIERPRSKGYRRLRPQDDARLVSFLAEELDRFLKEGDGDR